MISCKKLDSYTESEACKIFFFQHFNAQTVGKETHRHDFFQVVLLKKGHIRHFVDFGLQEADAPYISVIFPNQVHRMDLSDDAEVDVIMFDQTVFCSSILSNELKEYNVDLQTRLNHIQHVPQEEWTDIYAQLQLIGRLYDAVNMIRKWQIKFMIKIIILKIIDIAPSAQLIGNVDADVMIYQQFRAILDKDFASQKKVHHYASQLHITTKKLAAVCHKYTGRTPLQIIHEKLSLELKKVFIQEGLMLKEIAYRFGFSSQSALNKYVERHFGCSPQHLRTFLERDILGRS